MKQTEYMKVMAELEDEDGCLGPEQVVSAAKKKRPGDPLHDYFVWDNRRAGHAYRLSQARELLRLKVTVEIREVIYRLPNYVRNPAKEGGEAGYRSIAKVRTDEDARREVIVSEFARAGAALRRARDLAHYFGVQKSVDDIIGSVDTIHSQVEARA